MIKSKNKIDFINEWIEWLEIKKSYYNDEDYEAFKTKEFQTELLKEFKNILEKKIC